MYNLYLDSFLGIIEIICDDNYLLELRIVPNKKEENNNSLTIKVKNQLEEYFNKKRNSFNIPIKLIGTDFQKRVWKELLKIPYGTKVTYQDIANKINPKGIRAVSSAIGKNKILIIMPCHRVIGKNNSMTGYKAGIENKIKLLELEK